MSPSLPLHALSSRAPAATTTAAELAVLVSAVHRRVAAAAVDDVGALDDVALDIAPWLTVDEVARVTADVVARLDGLGELARLLELDDVTDIVINGPGEVYVERAGVLARSGLTLDADGVRLIVDRVSALVRRHLDERSSILEAALPSGHRVTVVTAPVAADGPHIAIRRFRRDLAGLDAFGERTPGLRDQVSTAVADGRSVLVVGATGSGKTTLVSALIDAIDPGQRVVVIEDTREITTSHPHVLSLTTQHDSTRGLDVDLDQLVRTSLRLRPDRIVVGEIRGAEALAMVHALTTGHAGGLATMHGSTAESALRRLQLLCGLGTTAESAVELVADHVRSAFGLIVTVRRCCDGRRELVDVVDAGPTS